MLVFKVTHLFDYRCNVQEPVVRMRLVGGCGVVEVGVERGEGRGRGGGGVVRGVVMFFSPSCGWGIFKS